MDKVRMTRCWLAIGCILLMGQAAGTRPDLPAVIGQLSGRMSEQNQAVQALTEADPKVVDSLLIERLKMNVAAGEGNRARTEHQALQNTPPVTAVWLRLGSENELMADILARHRATKAVPAIQAALEAAMKEDAAHLDPTLTRSLASSMYLLSGKTGDYFDADTRKAQPFVPRALEEETMRENLQLHLVPMRGLTALFAIDGKGNAGNSIAADEVVTLRLELTNKTGNPVALDLAAESFVIEYTDDSRRVAAAAGNLPEFSNGSRRGEALGTLGASETITVLWHLPAKDAALFKDWGTSYHNVRVRYAPAKDAAMKAAWGQEGVISNSVVRCLAK